MASLPIILVADAWGPKHGGINAFNYDLCKALGSRLTDSRPVICVVPRADDREVADAKASHVRLLPTRAETLDSGDVLMALKDSGIDRVAWVVGHDVKTGEVAIKAAKLLQAQAALIHHMAYGAYAAHKHGRGAEAVSRAKEQETLFTKADRCFAVGPLLRDNLNQMLPPGIEARVIYPGLPDIPPAKKARVFTAITFGRMDADDDRIKQGRLAVAGFAAARRWSCQNAGAPLRLTEKRPDMAVIGITEPGGDTEQSLLELNARYGGDTPPQVVAQPFTEDRKELFTTLAEADVAFMLSWHEGFGLTGWEAIAAEVPLILSNESGLFQLIKEQTGAPEAYVHTLSVGGVPAREGQENFSETDVEKVHLAVRMVAADYDAAVDKARRLRRFLQDADFTWRRTADQFLADLGLNDPPPDGQEGDSDTAPSPPVQSSPLEDRRKPLSETIAGLESLLLRPESQVVPFQGPLTGLCDDIVEWVRNEQAARQKVALRLYVAEGGSGKTRLMIETCARLRGLGWEAGFVPAERGAVDAVRIRLTELVTRQSRVFMVVDYAETRRPTVRAVVEACLRAPPDHRIRIVLLGRGQGDWWSLLRQEEKEFQLRAFLGSLESAMGPYDLPRPDAEDRQTRQELFDTAQTAFRPRLEAPVAEAPQPNLAAAPFRQMLFLHLAALASLHGRPLEQEGELLDATLDRERDYWARAIDGEGLDAGLLDGLAQAVALLTLLDGVASAKEAKAVIATVPGLRDVPAACRDKVFALLRRLYPRDGGLDALRPDLLGERHVDACLSQDQDILEEALDRDKHPDWTTRALTVLTRIAQHGDDAWLRRALAPERLTIPLVQAAMEVAVEMGDPLGGVLAQAIDAAPSKVQMGIVNHFAGRLPVQTDALSDFNTVILARRVELLRAKGVKKNAAPLIEAMNRLAMRLWRNGDFERALTVIDEAMVIREENEKYISNDHGYIAVLLGNRINILHDLGKVEEALLIAENGEIISGNAVDKNALADHISRLSLLHTRLGNYGEAISFAEESLKIRRVLSETRPEQFHADLGISLINITGLLRSLGRMEAALEAASEAETLWRDLAARHPDAHWASWGQSLGNRAIHLYLAGRAREALATARRSEQLWRNLARARPNAYNADWGLALDILGVALSHMGRHAEALACARQAIAVFRPLAAARPLAYSRNLATVLGNAAASGVYGGEGGEAGAWLSEAIALVAPLYHDRRVAMALLYGRLHAWRAVAHDDPRDAETALAILEEVKTLAPADVQPARALALAVLAQAGRSGRAAAAAQAEEAFALLEPHFRRRCRGLRLEMEKVVSALRATAEPGTGDPIPADVLSLLEEAQIPLADEPADVEPEPMRL